MANDPATGGADTSPSSRVQRNNRAGPEEADTVSGSVSTVMRARRFARAWLAGWMGGQAQRLNSGE
jgi:hypothetical protein